MPTKNEQFEVIESDRIDLLCIARDMFTAVQHRMAASSELSEMVFISEAEEEAYNAAMRLLKRELSKAPSKARKYLVSATLIGEPVTPN